VRCRRAAGRHRASCRRSRGRGRLPDFAYGTGTTAPTADKPQSKLWVNAGSWWGSLFSPQVGGFTIHRLDGVSQQWVDTGVLLDERPNAKIDALWEGANLYVAAAGPSSTDPGHSARVTRYSFADGQYVRDAGYPVTIASGGAESIVLDRDTKGVLWATYTRSGKVYVTHSTTGHATWVTPYVLPVAGAGDVSADDISTLVSFGGRIGVLWGNQNPNSPSGNSYWFAVHVDGTDDSPASWTRELAFGGDPATENADDHMNIKSLQTDSEGRVFASVKTSLNGSDDPLIVLLVRDPSGAWDRDNVFGKGAQNHTRAIVVLDDPNNTAHVFAASPCCSGGVIYHKKVSFAALANGNPFAGGLGAPFIRSSLDKTINNPTSTKQTVDGTSGLVVLAADDTSRWYLHNKLDLADPATLVPDTRIDNRPHGQRRQHVREVRVLFGQHQGDVRVPARRCRVLACTSPKEHTGLSAGSHTFEVRAVTAAGPDPTPASRSGRRREPASVLPAGGGRRGEGRHDEQQHQLRPDDVAGGRHVASGGELPALRSRVDRHPARDQREAAVVRFQRLDQWPGCLQHLGDLVGNRSHVEHPADPVGDRAGEPDVHSGQRVGRVQRHVRHHRRRRIRVRFGRGLVRRDGLQLARGSQQATARSELRGGHHGTGHDDHRSADRTLDTGTAEVAFSASEPSRFECRLDGSAYAECVSPKQYTDLGNGDHVFEVRAIDTAGNVDTSPAAAAWTVERADPTAPQTTLESAPSGTVSTSDAVISFSADEPGTFECSLDGSAFGECDSPVSYNDLPDGTHTFEVRAIDRAGNVDASPRGRDVDDPDPYRDPAQGRFRER
jgi:hypothetical protein